MKIQVRTGTVLLLELQEVAASGMDRVAAAQLQKNRHGSNPNERRTNLAVEKRVTRGAGVRPAGQKPRVCLAAENRLLRETLSRMLVKSGQLEVIVVDAAEFPPELLLQEKADILLLTSLGNIEEDLVTIRRVRGAAPSVLGEAVCPGTLCGVLFHYFEREASSFPSASVRQRLGLTRREQQLIPLIAEGMTNKEIANRFCLSEQTVKNHLYRMKHKIGAGDRLSIVQVCRTQGFMI